LLGGDDIEVGPLDFLQTFLPTAGYADLPALLGEHTGYFESNARGGSDDDGARHGK
jgi:hypothetical protein